MEQSVENKNGNNINFLLDKNLFDIEYNEKTMHQIITSYTNNIHTGIKKQKTRSEVSGGGKKPWRQKGTGRARAGTIRSPLWKGGGKIFAAKGISNRKKKINKKVYKLGLKIILSQLIRDKRLSIIDELNIEKNKTKNFITEINYLKDTKYSLFILKNIDKNLYLATRNLKNISISSYKNLNPLMLLKPKKIFITISGIKALQENLK